VLQHTGSRAETLTRLLRPLGLENITFRNEW